MWTQAKKERSLYFVFIFSQFQSPACPRHLDATLTPDHTAIIGEKHTSKEMYSQLCQQPIISYCFTDATW